MDRLPDITPDALTRYLREHAPELAQQIVSALNNATSGHIIAESERPVVEAGRNFIKAAFEQALQQKINAAEAAFPPSKEPLGPAPG